MQNLAPLVALVAVVLFAVAAFLTSDRTMKIIAIGLALLALALWVR